MKSFKSIIIAVLLFFILIPVVFAAWDGTTYDPGETLEPECGPTDTNCAIEPTAFDGTTYSASEQGIVLNGSTNVFSIGLDGSSLSISNSGLRISNTYTGQTSITTLGTVATGTWQGTAIGSAYGGTGVTGTPTNGQLLIGNGTGFSLTALSGSNGISVTNGAGSVGLSFDPSSLSTLSSADSSDRLVIYDVSSGLTKTITQNDLLAGVVGGFSYAGSWNASTNSPNIGATTPSSGTFYIVSTAGTTTLGGVSSWSIGDWAIYNGTSWEQVRSSSAVASVFGRTGVITANSGDYTASQITNVATGTISSTNLQSAINEVATEAERAFATGTTAQYFRGDKTWQTLSTAIVTEDPSNLYYTDARARNAFSVTGGSGLLYSTSTGAFSVDSTHAIPSRGSSTGETLTWNGSAWVATSSIVVGSLDIGSLNGVLFGTNGVVTAVATSSLEINSDAITEGSSNLFFTNTRADARVALGLSAATSTVRAAISASSPLAYDSSTGIISMATGYSSPLTASTSEWAIAYQNRITSVSSPLSLSNHALSLSTAGDWTGTFDGQEGSYYLNRANMTGTQPWSTIVSTPTTLVGYGITDAPSTSTIRASISASSPLAYDSSTGIMSVASGYSIPLTASTTAWNSGTVTNGTQTFAGNKTFSGVTTLATTTVSSLSIGSMNGLVLANNGSLSGVATSTLAINTDNLVEGSSNLFFTNTRADARVALGIGTGTSTFRNMLSSTATGLTYTPGTGIFSLDAGYTLPLTASTTAWQTALSNSSQWTTNGSNIYYTTGNVGVGTTTPLATLSVKGAGTTAATVNFTTTDSNNLRLFTILDSGNVGIGTTSPIAKLSVIGSAGANPFVIASSTGTQLITVTQSGNLGIGTTTPSEKLSVTGNAYVSGSVTSGSLSNCALSLGVNAAGTLVCAVSDGRLKDVQSQYMGGLDAIEQLQPVVYTWKEGSGFDTHTPIMGFIAQDVEHAIPEAGFTYNNGTKMYNHLGILGAVVNAIKELNVKVKTLASGIFEKITTKEVHTDKLCIGDTCVTAGELQEFIDEKHSSEPASEEQTSEPAEKSTPKEESEPEPESQPERELEQESEQPIDITEDITEDTTEENTIEEVKSVEEETNKEELEEEIETEPEILP